MPTNDLESLFVEQAEYLEDAQFSEWATQHPHELEILRKLRANGAKLIIGPRGCGKTTLLLKAWHRMVSDKVGEVLPIYVNFKSSLRLEPLYKSNANASFWFTQWLYLRTLGGLEEALLKVGSTAPTPAIEFALYRSIADRLQIGDLESAKAQLQTPITPSDFLTTIQAALLACGRHRIVLLFDDAGHAFSPEQQRDFFDFFRTTKSPFISPKAAIYPGITDFSATFHAGHDAEEINVWMDPSDSSYQKFMESLLKKRLPTNLFEQLKEDPHVLSLLALAAFGIPRNLLNMIREVADIDSESVAGKRRTIPRTSVLGAITDCSNTSLQVFSSLKQKLPIYSKFIERGEAVLRRMTDGLKAFNTSTSTSTKSVTVAIPAPLAPELKTLFTFYQYAGLVRPRGDVSRGEKGKFALLDLHYALLIDQNAIVPQRSVGLGEIATSLSKRSSHAFTRLTTERLLGATDVSAALPLMLPPCQVCNTPRADPAARFCLNCGAALTLKSTFETAVSQPISVLPLTSRRVQTITEQSNIRRVKDILLDKDHKELLRVKMIGPVWATRISRYAEEFLE